MGLLVALLVLPVARATDREPLPALAVERPLSLPLGWTMLQLGATRQGERLGLGGRIRYGALRGIELFVGGGAVLQQGSVGPSDPELGARLQLLRREPPNTALALELSFRAPYGASPGGVALGEGAPELLASAQLLRQAGPLATELRLGPALRGQGQGGPMPAALAGGLGLLLQLGPLAPTAHLQGELRSDGSRWLTGRAGLLLQLSRGLGLTFHRGWPWVGEDADRTLADAPETRFGLEIAF